MSRVKQRKRTEEIPHFELHVLYQLSESISAQNPEESRKGYADYPPNIGYVRRIVFNWQILLDLSSHIPTQIHLPKGFIAVDHVQNDGGGQLVVRGSSPVNRLKNVD